ncbi:hypothetical protein GCM10027589_00960 [Actinocorallia lasiicapitis]
MITYVGLVPYTPAAGEAPTNWTPQDTTWAAVITVRTLHNSPIRIHPTLTVQSTEGTFGGFLGRNSPTELRPGEHLELRALLRIRSNRDNISLLLDLGIPDQPRFSLVTGKKNQSKTTG